MRTEALSSALAGGHLGDEGMRTEACSSALTRGHLGGELMRKVMAGSLED